MSRLSSSSANHSKVVGRRQAGSRWRPVVSGLKRAAVGAAALPALALAFSLPAQANLVTNGGFVPNQTGWATGANSAFLGATNNTVLPGWKTTAYASTPIPFWGSVVGNGLTISTALDEAGLGVSAGFPQGPGTGLNVANTTSVNSADGSGWFLAVDADVTYVDTIEQTINGLIPGKSYTLSFSQAAAQYAAWPDAPITAWWDVTFGTSNFLSSTISVASGGAVSPWQSQSTSFTATNTSQVLKFLAQGTPTGGPPFVMLSGVSLTQDSSAPSSVPGPLPVAGVAAAFGFSRRLRQRIKLG